MRTICLLLYYGVAKHLDSLAVRFLDRLFRKFRYQLCRHIFEGIGKNVNISANVYFGNGSNIVVGNNSGFGRNFWVQNTNLKIGNNVMMGQNVMILGGGHQNVRTDIPMIEQGNLGKSVLTIGDDVWIGARVIILGNTQTIGNGVIIGAGSVVTKPIPDFAVVAGNPARVIRFRK